MLGAYVLFCFVFFFFKNVSSINCLNLNKLAETNVGVKDIMVLRSSRLL